MHCTSLSVNNHQKRFEKSMKIMWFIINSLFTSMIYHWFCLIAVYFISQIRHFLNYCSMCHTGLQNMNIMFSLLMYRNIYVQDWCYWNWLHAQCCICVGNTRNINNMSLVIPYVVVLYWDGLGCQRHFQYNSLRQRHFQCMCKW